MEILRQFQTAVFDDFCEQGEGSAASFWAAAYFPYLSLIVTVVVLLAANSPAFHGKHKLIAGKPFEQRLVIINFEIKLNIASVNIVALIKCLFLLEHFLHYRVGSYMWARDRDIRWLHYMVR